MSMEKMEDKERKDFLAASGYMTMRRRILSSCSLKEFYQLMEKKVNVKEDGTSDELEFVQLFLMNLDRELDGFEERVHKQIEELELKQNPHMAKRKEEEAKKK